MAEVKVPDLSVTWLGNILFALAMAFGVDTLLVGGTVTGFLPDPIKGLIAFVIFIGVFVYAFKQAKKLN